MSFPKIFYRWRPHPWHGLDIGRKAPDVVNAYIEVTPFDAVKYEIDKATGYLRADWAGPARDAWTASSRGLRRPRATLCRQLHSLFVLPVLFGKWIRFSSISIPPVTGWWLRNDRIR
jgi:hypothetical protein